MIGLSSLPYYASKESLMCKIQGTTNTTFVSLLTQNTNLSGFSALKDINWTIIQMTLKAFAVCTRESFVRNPKYKGKDNRDLMLTQ